MSDRPPVNEGPEDCPDCGVPAGAFHVMRAADMGTTRSALERWNQRVAEGRDDLAAVARPSSFLPGTPNAEIVYGGDGGENGPATFEDMMLTIAGDAARVCFERQRKYGPRNITRAANPLYALAVRLGDKLARLEVAVASGEVRDEHADESLSDTLIDIANYAMIAEAVRRGWWTPEHCPPLAT